MTGVILEKIGTPRLRHKQIHEFCRKSFNTSQVFLPCNIVQPYSILTLKRVIEQDHRLWDCTLTRVDARDFKMWAY